MNLKKMFEQANSDAVLTNRSVKNLNPLKNEKNI